MLRGRGDLSDCGPKVLRHGTQSMCVLAAFSQTRFLEEQFLRRSAAGQSRTMWGEGGGVPPV